MGEQSELVYKCKAASQPAFGTVDMLKALILISQKKMAPLPPPLSFVLNEKSADALLYSVRRQ